MDRETYVRALLREREGYVLRGRENRVADVDAELDRLGVVHLEREKFGPLVLKDGTPETTEAAPTPERSVPPKPQRPGR